MGMQGAEQVQRGEGEEGEGEALGVVRGVGGWEEGFETAEVVADVLVFVEDRGRGRGRKVGGGHWDEGRGGQMRS